MALASGSGSDCLPRILHRAGHKGGVPRRSALRLGVTLLVAQDCRPVGCSPAGAPGISERWFIVGQPLSTSTVALGTAEQGAVVTVEWVVGTAVGRWRPTKLRPPTRSPAQLHSARWSTGYVSSLPRVSITESFSRRYRVDAGITVSSSTPTKVKEAMVANSVITSIG